MSGQERDANNIEKNLQRMQELRCARRIGKDNHPGNDYWQTHSSSIHLKHHE
jgi:hypothetical protein